MWGQGIDQCQLIGCSLRPDASVLHDYLYCCAWLSKGLHLPAGSLPQRRQAFACGCTGRWGHGAWRLAGLSSSSLAGPGRHPRGVSPCSALPCSCASAPGKGAHSAPGPCSCTGREYSGPAPSPPSGQCRQDTAGMLTDARLLPASCSCPFDHQGLQKGCAARSSVHAHCALPTPGHLGCHHTGKDLLT